MTTAAGSLHGGPLETVWAYSSTSCDGKDSIWQDRAVAGQLYLQYGPPMTQSPDCYPPSYIPVSTFYYSPGSCPTGYTVACSSDQTGPLSEVMAVCCPSGPAFSCAEKQTDSESVYIVKPWLTTLQCWSSITETRVVTLTDIGRRSNTVATRTFTDGIVGAYAINVQTFADWSGSTSSSDAYYGGVYDSHPSLGVAVGVGIGAAVAVLLIAVAAWWLLRRRRRRRQLRDRPLELSKITLTPEPSAPSTVVVAGVPDSAEHTTPDASAPATMEDVSLVEGKFRVEDVAASRFKS